MNLGSQATDQVRFILKSAFCLLPRPRESFRPADNMILYLSLDNLREKFCHAQHMSVGEKEFGFKNPDYNAFRGGRLPVNLNLNVNVNLNVHLWASSRSRSSMPKTLMR